MSCLGYCCQAMFSVTPKHVCEITPTLWTLLTVILILYTSIAVTTVTLTCTDHVAVWHKPESVCDAEGPILLSRALTTDPFRGITIISAFACALFYGYSPSSSPVRVPLIGVLCMIGVAFIVSMFETNAHFYIINLTTGAALFFTCPIWHDFHEAWKNMNGNTADDWDAFFADARNKCCIQSNQDPLWWILWVCICVLAGVTGALLYTFDDVRSWVYVVEYVFFWSLFWSLEWTIMDAEEKDETATLISKQEGKNISKHVSIYF